MPFLHTRPNRGKGPKFGTAANEDRDLALQRIRIVGGLAQVFDVLEEAFENFPGIIQYDHTITGIASRAPQEIGLVAAECGGKSVTAAKEIDGARLSVVLCEDATPRAFLWRELGVRLIDFSDYLFPSELGWGMVAFACRK